MQEGSEGASSQRPETGQNRSAEVHSERPRSEVELKIEEQNAERVKNAREIVDKLGQISDINPDTPLGQETKEKLSKVEEGMSEHQMAAFVAGISAVGSGVLEGLNYFGGWGAPPGAATKVVMAFGGTTAGTIEIGAAAIKGIEKLKGLVAKNKAPEGSKA